MLLVPGSKITYFSKKIFQVLHVLVVFGTCVLRDTIALPYTQHLVCWGSIPWILWTGTLLYLEYLGVRYSGMLLYLGVFWRSILWDTFGLEVFRDLIVLILSILGVFQDSILRGAVIAAAAEFQG